METGFGETATPIERFRFQLRQLFDTFQWIPRSERTIALLATRELLVEIEFLTTCQNGSMGHATGMQRGVNSNAELVEKSSGKIFTNLEPITSSFDNLDLTQIQTVLQNTLEGGSCIGEVDPSSMSVCRRLSEPALLVDEDDDDDMVSATHSQLIDAVYSEMRHQASLMAEAAAESCCGVPSLLDDGHRPHRAPSEAGSDAFLELSTFAAEMQNSAKDLLDHNDVLSKDLACETDTCQQTTTTLNSFQSQVSAEDLAAETGDHNQRQQSVSCSGVLATLSLQPREALTKISDQGADKMTESINHSTELSPPPPPDTAPQQRITRSMISHSGEDDAAPLPPRDSRKRPLRGKVLRTGKRMDRLLAARRLGAKRLKENHATVDEPSKATSKSLRRRRRRETRRHSRERTHPDHQHHDEQLQQSESPVSCRICRTEFPTRETFDLHQCDESCKASGDGPNYPGVLNELSFSPRQPHKPTVVSSSAAAVREVAGGRRSYQCSQCERRFAKRPSLYVHLRRHVVAPRVVCLKCGLVCDDEAHHGRHVLVHARKPKFRCAKCGEGFDRRQQYDQHLGGHHKYDCSLCEPSLPLATKQQTLRHRRQVHGILTRQERRHECKECRARFTRPALLETHLRETHLGESTVRPTPCSLCDKRFRSADALAKHLQKHSTQVVCGGDVGQHRRPSKSSGSNPPLLCAKCGATFYRNQDLLRHMQQRHSEEKKFECPFCDFRCKCKTNLKRHIELHKDEKRFVCELCGASFNAHATLKDHHAYVHSDARSFVCPSCNKGFKGRSGLRRHLRSHSDARPYACQCGQAYKRMSHLKRHMAALHNVVFKSKRVQRLGGGGSGGGEDGLTDYCLSEDDLAGTLQLADHVLSGAALDLDSVQPLNGAEFLGSRLPMPSAVHDDDQCLLSKLDATGVLTQGAAHDLDFGDDDDVTAHLDGVSLSTGPLPSISQLSAGFLSDNLAQFLSMQ